MTYKIPLSNEIGLISVVGKKEVIERWKGIYSLPDDDLSIENGIILESTKRSPLCIDPQTQANQ